MISIAHLHPIVVHFTVALGVLWTFRQFYSKAGRAGERVTRDALLELLLVAAIVAISTGWLALAWDKAHQFPGTRFISGWVHETLALVFAGGLWFRFRRASDGTCRHRWLYDGCLLILLLGTAMTGENLVFHWGAGTVHPASGPS